MAIHSALGESSFDQLLNMLLDRKRKLAKRMFLPPVNLRQDQSWFAENLNREAPRYRTAPVDMEEIDCMEPIVFERWVLSRCISVGWEASRTPGSYDGGADGVLIHRVSKTTAIVQCKHKRDAEDLCGPEAIDDLLRARTKYDGSARLFVLTNAEKFTRTTEERAERYGIALVGRRELAEWPRQLMY
jgi:HJR/Mrr/RecB family endonuclease